MQQVYDNSLSTLSLSKVEPDKDANWINQTNNDFDELVPVVNEEQSVFGMLSYGSQSNRDEWVYDFDRKSLENKMKYFTSFYNNALAKYHKEKPTSELKDWVDKKIKWTRGVTNYLRQENKLTYSKTNIKLTAYRPFVTKIQYFEKPVIEWTRKFSIIFRNSKPNKLICFPNPKTNLFFQTLAADKIVDTGCILDTQCLPLYTYDSQNKCHNNVTDFGLKLFQTHYKNNKITYEDIFYYTYAIFNDPKYSSKYKFNLQRKFPRIPLAGNFSDWVKIGRKLYDLHVNFESVKKYPLKLAEKKTTKNQARLLLKKPKGEDSSHNIVVIIDDHTTLEGIPNEALQYRFSSKCALEWILEFYKESKNAISEKSCDDPTVREKFNTYRFADHKEHVIDLLQRVTTVSVETVRLRRELEGMPWGKQPKPYPGKSGAGVDKTAKKSQKGKSRQPKKPKAAKKSRGKPKFQDTLDGAGQKRLFVDDPAA